MKVKISEVWNHEARSEELVIIYTTSGAARQDVEAWIAEHRPDLKLAESLSDHGYHAVETKR